MCQNPFVYSFFGMVVLLVSVQMTTIADRLFGSTDVVAPELETNHHIASQSRLSPLSIENHSNSGVHPVLISSDQALEKTRYVKKEHRIAMRDGVTLHTTIYAPGDATKKYPILLHRTPYGCWPYGDQSRDPIMYNEDLVKSGYIFVYQDIRSRSMSDGEPEFENLKPAYSLADPKAIDEVTDASDTMDWLIANVPNHNGRIGMFGSSYMGYTTLMGSVSAHKHLKAALVAAPSVDIFFEDFNRNGLFTLAYVPILDWFGTAKSGRFKGPWWENNLSYWADGKRFGLAKDSYQFYLKKGALSNFSDLIPESNYFWKQIKAHPNYDQFRKSRNVLQYLKRIECPTLVVGGFNDEQNLYGIFNSYQTIRKENPNSDVKLIVGPWAHSEHKDRANVRVGNIFFGDEVRKYQTEYELRFFEHHLKGADAPKFSTATIYDTGLKRWIESKKYPLESTNQLNLFFESRERLGESVAEDKNGFFEYISDPAKPVPYSQSDQFHLFPDKASMTGDQRFASKRPDVLTFITEPLKENLQIVGSATAKLQFSTDQSDADIIVKLIDVLPENRTPESNDVEGIKMNGYQQLIRFGQIRGRFRKGYSKPVPLTPNKKEEVSVSLLDVCHTFKKGHRVMIQIQSTLFPLFDRNPQKYVENIYLAKDSDFEIARHKIFSGSSIQLNVRTPQTGR